MNEMMLTARRKRALTDDLILMNFEGADGAIAFIDESPNPKIFSRLGGAALSTLQSKFGNSSLLIPVNSGAYIQGLNAIPGGTGLKDFFISAWVRPNNSGAYEGFFHQGADETKSAYGMVLAPAGLHIANVATTNWHVVQFTTPPAANVWTQVAVARRDGIFRLFSNGIKQGVDVGLPGYAYPGSESERMVIGKNIAAGYSINGYIDRFRMVLDDYVHWENFTPETE